MSLMFDLIENDCQNELAQLFREIKCYDFIGPPGYFIYPRPLAPRHSDYEYCEWGSLNDKEVDDLKRILEDFRKEFSDERRTDQPTQYEA